MTTLSRMFTAPLVALTMSASAVAASACSSSTGVPGSPDDLTIALAVPSLIVGTTARATAVATDSLGAEVDVGPVAWRSANDGIATVDAAGVVTAVAAGVTEIVATAPGLTASRAVIVTAPHRFDTFAAYSSFGDVQANVGADNPYCEIISPAHISLDAAVRYNGHQTVKVTQPAGTSDIARLTSCFTTQNFWFRIKLRFSPGWTTAGSNANTANSFKMFGWWWREGPGRGDLEITNTTGYQLHYSPQFSGGAFESVSAGSVSTEWSDGGWYDYIIHYQVTASGTRTRFWLAKDGETPVLRATVNGTGSATAEGIGFPFYFNQTVRSTQSVWIGQWEVVDGARYANPFGLQ